MSGIRAFLIVADGAVAAEELEPSYESLDVSSTLPNPFNLLVGRPQDPPEAAGHLLRPRALFSSLGSREGQVLYTAATLIEIVGFLPRLTLHAVVAAIHNP